MANRMFNQFGLSLEKSVVTLFATVNGAGASAPLLQSANQKSVLADAGAAGFRGIKSITRTGVGDYTINLQDTYNRLLMFHGMGTLKAGGGAPTTWNFYIHTNNVASATAPSIRIIVYGATIGTPVEIPTTDQWFFQIVLSNSSAI